MVLASCLGDVRLCFARIPLVFRLYSAGSPVVLSVASRRIPRAHTWFCKHRLVCYSEEVILVGESRLSSAARYFAGAFGRSAFCILHSAFCICPKTLLPSATG